VNKGDYLARYKRWWLGRLVRPEWANEDAPGWPRRVSRIEVYGPESFVSGYAELHFEGGGRLLLPLGGHAFRPRKSDLIVVKEEDSE